MQKKSTDYYWVTVSGYYPDLSIYIDATFDVYYYDDSVSASISHAYVDGEYFDDEMSLLLVMGILCGAA